MRSFIPSLSAILLAFLFLTASVACALAKGQNVPPPPSPPTGPVSVNELLLDLGSSKGATREASGAQLKQYIDQEIVVALTRSIAASELDRLTADLVRRMDDALARAEAKRLLEYTLESVAQEAMEGRRNRALRLLEELLQAIAEASEDAGLIANNAVEKVLGDILEEYGKELRANRSTNRRNARNSLDAAFDTFWKELDYGGFWSKKTAFKLLDVILEAIEDALNDRDEEVQLEAVDFALELTAHIDDDLDEGSLRTRRLREEVYETLIDLLDSADARTRQVAAETLGELGNPKAVKALEPLLKDEKKKVTEAAAEAIEQLTGKRPKVKR